MGSFSPDLIWKNCFLIGKHEQNLKRDGRLFATQSIHLWQLCASNDELSWLFTNKIQSFLSYLQTKTTICVNSESVKPSCLEAWHNGSIRFCNFTYMFKGFSSSDCRDFTFVFSWSKSFWSCNTSFFISSIFCAVFCKLASSCLSLLTSILKTRTSSSLSRKIASPKIWYIHKSKNLIGDFFSRIFWLILFKILDWNFGCSVFNF